MGKYPNGIIHPHIKESHGGDSSLMKFYATTNATTYGAHFEPFTPQPGKHKGTGYQANFRPQVYYTPRLDQMDNNYMGCFVKGNYQTITKRDYNSFKLPNGREVLPLKTHSQHSGYVNETALTVPDFKTSRQQFIDTRLASAPADIAPMHRPHLHNLKRHDPIREENFGHGPSSNKSEYKNKYLGSSLENVNLARASLGPKETTGFTQNHKTIEPVTYNPDSTHRNDLPGWMTTRPTGSSMHTAYYQPLKYLNGTEPLASVRNRSTRDTGYTTGNNQHPVFVHRSMADAYENLNQIPELVSSKLKKSDPASFLNNVNPNNKSSVYQGTYLGEQGPCRSKADQLGTKSVGSQEATGHTSNEHGYLLNVDLPDRFITSYNTKFYDVAPKGKDRDCQPSWGVQALPLNGFTKSTKTHDFGSPLNARAELLAMDPYQARSIRLRDTFHSDQTHDAKLYSLARQHTVI